MHFEISSAICFNLDQSKILSSGNGLNSRFKEESILNFHEQWHFVTSYVNGPQLLMVHRLCAVPNNTDI